MNFTTVVPINKLPDLIDYDAKLVSIGSCFAVNIGEKLDYFKFQNEMNPFGIIFNPLSIERLISRVVDLDLFKEADVFFNNERFHCYEVHSDLSSSNKAELLAKLNLKLGITRTRIAEATHIFITYGTSWVYFTSLEDLPVANCHKMAQEHFQKKILTVAQIEESIQQTIDAIRRVNPKVRFVFTVSPVRHIKDGFVENQRSKAHLITGLQNIISANKADCFYFPSYEIMMDELRDYRFYAEDLLHPSSVAIDYIWERFCESMISEKTTPILEEIEKIQKMKLHRPFNPNSESYIKFESKLIERIERIKAKYSFMQF